MLIGKRLFGENFFTFKSLDVRLDNQGLVSVEGFNLDADPKGRSSNGAGAVIRTRRLRNYHQEFKR